MLQVERSCTRSHEITRDYTRLHEDTRYYRGYAIVLQVELANAPARKLYEAAGCAEMQPRCSRDAAEMLPRGSRDAAEMLPRC